MKRSINSGLFLTLYVSILSCVLQYLKNFLIFTLKIFSVCICGNELKTASNPATCFQAFKISSIFKKIYFLILKLLVKSCVFFNQLKSNQNEIF